MISHHFLIGAPGSGKSTFAQQLAKHIPSVCMLSTDTIRAKLYEDENTQGKWEDIAKRLFEEAQSALAIGKSIIYDATNARRSWRIDTLQQFAARGATHWIGWYAKMTLEECLSRNQQRSRQVAQDAVVAFSDQLRLFPPVSAEGFVAVYEIPYNEAGQIDLPAVERLIRRAEKSVACRESKYADDHFHAYAALVDFDRLMHLLALLIRYPGVGSLHDRQPEQLRKILGLAPNEALAITDSHEEICALMAKCTTLFTLMLQNWRVILPG
jgi:predicted kinase